MNAPRMTLSELQHNAAINDEAKRRIAAERLEEIRKSIPRLLTPDSNEHVRRCAEDAAWVLELFDIMDAKYKRRLAKQARSNAALTDLVTRLLGYLQQRAQSGDEAELLHMRQTLDRIKSEVVGLDGAMDLGALLRGRR